MRFLVTGVSGLIGSNLAAELARSHEVVGLCNFSPGSEDNARRFGGKFHRGDIRDFDYGSLGGFDGCFHQAAVTDTTVTDPKLMFSTNVDAFARLLEWAWRSGCRKVVYASSAATYGKGRVPMKETDVPAPANIYGESKVEMEKAALRFAKEHPGMTIVGLRYFNVYGPGETHKLKAASMVYQLYRRIASGEAPRVFKWGEQSRDFIYVKDVAAANVKAFELDRPGAHVFNVGTGARTSFNRVIEILNRTLGASRPTEYFDNPYAFYQDETQADTSLAESILGFKCAYPPEQGIPDYALTIKKMTAAA